MTPHARRQQRRLLAATAAALALACMAWAPQPAVAQGCSMCRETAGFQQDRAIRSLKQGILALAVPPLAIAVGLTWVTWKRRNGTASD